MIAGPGAVRATIHNMLDDFHQMDIITDFQEENENEEQFNGIPKLANVVHFFPSQTGVRILYN